MVGLEISRNGRKCFVAGGPDLASLNAVVLLCGRLGPSNPSECDPFGALSVMGSSTEKDGKFRSLSWNESGNLNVGDEIVIRVVETDEVSAPTAEELLDAGESE